MSQPTFLRAAVLIAVMTGLSGAAWAQRPYRSYRSYRSGEVCVSRQQVADDLAEARVDLRELERMARYEHPAVRHHVAGIRSELNALTRMFGLQRRWDDRSRVCADRDDIEDSLAAASRHLRMVQRVGGYDRTMRLPIRSLRRELRGIARTFGRGESYGRGVMSSGEFARFLEDVDELPSSRERATLILELDRPLTVDQLAQLLGELPYSQQRVEIAARVRVVDPENFIEVYDYIPNEADRAELRRRIARRYDEYDRRVY